MTNSTVHLLINPSVRGGKAASQIDAATRALRAHGATVLQVSAATPYETEQVAGRLVDDGAERLIVVGGDGMVHIAVQAVAESDTILGIIPLGSGNDFAASLGMSSAIDVAARTALSAPGSIDLMRVGHRWAASVATAGFSVDVNARANTMRWPRSGSRYTVATLLQLGHLHAREFELTVDGEVHDAEATLVTVANTTDFGGGMRITPAADPSDGFVDITLVGATSRIELLRWFRKVFDGSHLDHPSVTTLRGKKITLSEGAGEVWADGEPIAVAPVTIEVIPGALRLAGAHPVAS